MTDQNLRKGQLAAAFTVFLWGTTFISTKLLLESFTPVEILFIRFLLGFAALTLACPKRLKLQNKKQEIYFLFAGLSGICLYYLFENIALTYTLASNVGVIISVAPFFTALLDHFIFHKQSFQPRFLVGFIVAMAGICLISFHGAQLHLNPAGDLLALAAAFLWACYSILTKKISTFGYSTILTTRRIFFYGIICMIPFLFLFSFHPPMEQFKRPDVIFHFLFLGLGACALCFVTWNYAVKILGALKSSIFIYMVPVVTVISSAVVLGEAITPLSAAGTVLTLIGLFLSGDFTGKKETEQKTKM